MSEEVMEYLTMTRIMGDEWKKYQKKSIWGYNLTGMDNVKAKDAFEQGFIAGFSGKYFGEKND
jgi:hypothetical protein